MTEVDVKELTTAIKALVGRFDLALDHIKDIEQDVFQQGEAISKHNRILFGDGDMIRGLIGRQNKVEDRFALFWTSMGVLISAVIVAAVNFFVHR